MSLVDTSFKENGESPSLHGLNRVQDFGWMAGNPEAMTVYNLALSWGRTHI